ncbi:hypothetical protein R6Z07F_018100 [Ovis aries]
MDLEGETPACLEMPSSQGTRTKRGGCPAAPGRADARSGRQRLAQTRRAARTPPFPPASRGTHRHLAAAGRLLPPGSPGASGPRSAGRATARRCPLRCQDRPPVPKRSLSEAGPALEAGSLQISTACERPAPRPPLTADGPPPGLRLPPITPLRVPGDDWT